jgi:Flp pilus assembly protein TadD
MNLRISLPPRRLGRHLPLAAMLALTLGLAPVWAPAADTPPEPVRAAPADPLGGARSLIKSARWSAAIEELRRVNASGDADWNNLMGYALRKQARPDLDAAQRHYDAALQINPQHPGALEYSGELALMKGDLATAEARLASLQQLCRTPCEPLDDLKRSIARYKAGAKS